jgi:hypothetical protein
MTPASNTRSTRQATPRSEHETRAQRAERCGERPGEGASGLRQLSLQDVGQEAGPSRYIRPLHVLRRPGQAQRAPHRIAFPMGSCMNTTEQIADVQARLQHAVSSTALLQRAGAREQYLESYFLVEALELQLAQLRQDRASTVAARPV